MSIPVVTFFNNKGGVGKTTMVYHLAWMFAERGLRVIGADLDPQCNLTAAFLDEEQVGRLLDATPARKTIFGAIEPLKSGTGDIGEAFILGIDQGIGLVPGDMALSTFEDQLSEVWPKCMDADERAFRVTSAFWRIVQSAAERHRAQVILIDVGPNLGAINRAALIATDFVVIPLGPDLFSLQGLRNLGPALHRWRGQWRQRLEQNPVPKLRLPPGDMTPAGYVVLRHSIRLDRPVKAFERWIAKIPSTYAEAVLEKPCEPARTIDTDPNCIAKLRDYRSLLPLAQEAHKPMFMLKPADGALGAHTYAVADAYKDFQDLSTKIGRIANLRLPAQ